MLKPSCLLGVLLASTLSTHAQSDGPARFEVASIKRNVSGEVLGTLPRFLPNGTVMMINQPIRFLLTYAPLVMVRDVVGFPDWVATERYDLTAKASTGDERRSTEMVRTLLQDRLKLSGHVEERDMNTFALVLANKNGKLGPQLKPTTKRCVQRDPEAPPEPCHSVLGAGVLAHDSLSMEGLALILRGHSGRFVNDRTGLRGFYEFTLTFKPTGPLARGTASSASNDDLPDLFTAIQDQLGLKLQSEKSPVPVFVVDHIERPTEN
jgi:bla regulator protein blaR1